MLTTGRRNPAKISKTTTCGGAETIVASIDDLLIEILVHLPTKPLFRFKLVSKHWNSIISDPKFESRHQQAHNNNNNKNRAAGLLFQNLSPMQPLLPPTMFIRVVPLNDRLSSNPVQSLHELKVSHSCNGLLVLRNAYMYGTPECYVYNPTTNQTTENLLKGYVFKLHPRDFFYGMFLAFDPSKSPHYKVVSVWMKNDKRKEYRFEVYSSETRSWEKSCGGAYYSIKNTGGDVNFDNGVYWNGAIHWLGKNVRDDSIYFNPDDDDEVAAPRVMPNPPPSIRKRDYYFGESCGHLHCAGLVGEKNMPRRRIFIVYEMRRDYSEWFLKFRVVISDGGPNIRRHLFCVLRGGGNKLEDEDDEDDSFLVWGTDRGDVLRYDLVRKTFQTIANDVCLDVDHEPNYFQYIESPCSV